MRLLADITEDSMVAAFLAAEIRSERFGGVLGELFERDGLSPRLVERPNLESTADNHRRRLLLGAFRGYGEDRDLFEGFPGDVRWQRVALTRAELAQVHYIRYSYWEELTCGTRIPADGVARIRANRPVYGVPMDGFLRAEAALRQGAVFPELIVVRAGAGEPLVVLEGHLRLTAYALAPQCLPDELSVILGRSPLLPGWWCY
jgi:hypothetical protein